MLFDKCSVRRMNGYGYMQKSERFDFNKLRSFCQTKPSQAYSRQSLDWIVRSVYSSGGHILGCFEMLIFCDKQTNRHLPIIHKRHWSKNIANVGPQSLVQKRHQCGPQMTSFGPKKKPTRGPKWPPVVQKRHQRRASIGPKASPTWGPNWPFRCLDKCHTKT